MALSTPHGEAKGDEDKGSPLQNGANLARSRPAARENRQISGSPSGVPPPVSLSLRN